MALMEEYIPGRTENLHDYLIPTIGDVPPIETNPGSRFPTRKAVRRQGPGRACADPDGTGDPQRHQARHRRPGHQGSGDADAYPRRHRDKEARR